MLNILRKMFGAQTDYKALLHNGAMIIDVRTEAEFKSGHIKNSRNIPLNIITGKIEELRNKEKPVITVCRSGNRSGMAQSVLAAAGIEAYNGGAWNQLEAKIQ